MEIVFISGVELGLYALKGILGSQSFRNGEAILKAVFALAEDKSSKTSGYQSFDDLSQSNGITLHKITSIKTESVIKQIAAYSPDLIFIIGWSELAPSDLLDVPKKKHNSQYRHASTHGCIGIHPTLLPQGRGRAPIPWAIIKGLKKSGVTMFYLEERADAGDVIDQREFDIHLDDDASSVYGVVAKLHYELMKDNLPLLVKGIAPRTHQDPNNVTFWPKRTPEDGIIDWSMSQADQYNWIRALTHPYPGAFTFWKGHKITIWKAHLRTKDHRADYGQVVDISDEGIIIACKDGALLLNCLQFENEPELESAAFAMKYGLAIGDILGVPSWPDLQDIKGLELQE